MILFKYIMKSWKLSWKEEVFVVLFCFNDKESDEKILVFYKDKVSDESTSLY